MAHDAAAAPEGKKSPDPKTIWFLGLAVVGILFLGGYALNFFLTEFGGGLRNFAVQAAGGATAGQPALTLLLMIGLAITALIAIPIAGILAAFKAYKVINKPEEAPAATPAATT
jgi:hypothetical protein